MYRKAIKQMLSQTKKYGGKTGHMQPIEFFFYADTEDKGSNLAIGLVRFPTRKGLTKTS